jgi:uncharacterized membrane protein
MTPFWPLFVLASAGLQVVRNASQRGLTQQLGLMGATYVRFAFGLPFALIWAALTLLWRGPSGAMSFEFWAWVIFGAATQAAATAGLVRAMRGRAFAVATAFTKSEVLATAGFGVLMLHDILAPNDWIGAALGTIGIFAMAQVSVDRDGLRAAASGVGAGILFALASVAARGASHAWGPDPWLGAAVALSAALSVQTIVGGVLMAVLQPDKLKLMLREWRACLVPGAAGGIASAFIYTAFSTGPSAGAVKAVQLVDVILAWGVSHRLFKERIRLVEALGIVLVLAGALTVVL